jgi:hypothetical protein
MLRVPEMLVPRQNRAHCLQTAFQTLAQEQVWGREKLRCCVVTSDGEASPAEPVDVHARCGTPDTLQAWYMLLRTQ